MAHESNDEKYALVFLHTFELTPGEVEVEQLSYQSIPQWDSIAHLSLIMNLEEAFAISIDAEDVIEFGSYAKGKDILRKYDVELA
jgi:acyl carrier protein